MDWGVHTCLGRRPVSVAAASSIVPHREVRHRRSIVAIHCHGPTPSPRGIDEAAARAAFNAIAAVLVIDRVVQHPRRACRDGQLADFSNGAHDVGTLIAEQRRVMDQVSCNGLPICQCPTLEPS